MHVRGGQMISEKWITFECDVCNTEFETRMKADDPDPDCPVCWQRERRVADKTAQMIEEGRGPATIHRLHGADVTYKMLERDTGITDLNDQLREGDVAYKADSPRTAAEETSLVRQEVEHRAAMATQPVPSTDPARAIINQTGWGGMQGANPQGDAGAHIANAQNFAAQARSMGADPLSFTGYQNTPGAGADKKHHMNAAPKVKPRFDVLARADTKGNVVPPSVRRKS